MCPVVYRYRQIVCNIIAKRRNGAVIIRSAPFSENIRQAVNKRFNSVFASVVKHKLLARFFAFSVRIVERRLNRRRDKHRRFIVIFFESVQQG